MAVSQIRKGSVRPQYLIALDECDVMQKQPGKGSAKPEQETSTGQASSVTGKCRVLLAEDDDEMRALLAWWLSKYGFDVTECDHGIDLINRIDPLGVPIEPHKFDLIISDIRMPGITGLDVLEDVRLCETECPPVIFITAFGDRDTHQQAHRLGAAAIFDKPFDFNKLLAKAHELVNSGPFPHSGIPEGKEVKGG